MAWFLFVDESGHDRKASPYEVLAGVAIQDRVLWTLINKIHETEIKHFGRRYSAGSNELKGTKILKNKVFQHAQLNVSVAQADIQNFARFALDQGASAQVQHLKALALAKLAYVKDVFDLCIHHECKAFASVVEIDAHPTSTDGLRKDYAFLFERFFYWLEDGEPKEHGIVVFDELEKSKSHLLIDQTHRYFKESATGRHRATLIVPEPFFVHSELTTGIQIADLVAYVISWGFRTTRMSKRSREELRPFANQVGRLRYKTMRERRGNPNFEIWSFAHITDLRTNLEREFDDE
ncbi:MAG: DUF3800 domain-containing protein [Rhodospirillales bacterium]